MNNTISLSGGKDSTAMLNIMLGRGESIHSAVFFDTGWEFPEMLEHIIKGANVNTPYNPNMAIRHQNPSILGTTSMIGGNVIILNS